MRLMRGSVLFTVNVFNTFVMLQKLRNHSFHAYLIPAAFILNDSIQICFRRLFSWVQQKPLSIGSTGCLHSLSMQSKTQSSGNGSISNVPLF